ncbi:MAG: hypothetical protein K0R99_928 [Microbacterium sp.]|jgi:hypothetical protein|uniref:hypothetical protein n=1 Tax=Microbacterium sp. TaxID=51671 RepID=UPI002626016E|nr:hypothetical protein [Microbacterium sp.]MDF2559482.1 hypothetical protein [Microbacterium sp.]
MLQNHAPRYEPSTKFGIAFNPISPLKSSIKFGKAKTEEHPMAVENFLEEEEYETTFRTPSSVPNYLADEDEDELPSAETPEAKFGEPGFGKGKPKVQPGTPRARLTPIDEYYMVYIKTLTGASAEALSMIRERNETNLDLVVGGFPTIKSIENRMRKLKKLGMVFAERHIGTGVTSYSLTPLGIDALESAGYDIDDADTLIGATLERLHHYKNISQVGAMFAAGLFEDSLDVGPVPIENLVSEKAMRGASAPLKAELRKLRAEGQPGDWGPRRELELQRATLRAQKTGDWTQFVRTNPAVLTLPIAASAGKKFKGVYEPDLAVILDDARTGAKARNLLVEIELSKKSEPAYHAIFKTLEAEFAKPLVYSGAVFMVIGEMVANRIRKVNAEGKYGLIESGQVQILPITHRDGTPLPAPRRITVGGN